MAVTLFSASGASASTVYLGINLLIFEDGTPNETNTVSIKAENGALTIIDSTAVLSGGTGCDQIDEHTVTCGFGKIVVLAHGMNDSVTTDVSLETEIQGGDGDDVLTYTGTGSSTLWGEDGNDTLTTGGGEDTLFGGAGNDVVSDGGGPLAYLIGGGGDDVLHGGGGKDCVGGSAGFDTLSGDLGNDTLKGGGGDDSLRGNDGNDVLMGAAGHDLMSGGSGKDGFAARDNLRDRLLGGTGIDRAFIDSGLDRKKSIENLLSGRQSFFSITQCSFPFFEEQMPRPIAGRGSHVSALPRLSARAAERPQSGGAS
jgi:Ca2+-binding RTX toxin-like protein